MHVLTCTDSRFVIPTGVMLTSLIINNQDDIINIHLIIDASVTDNQKEQLKSEFGRYNNTTLSFYTINVEDIKEYLVVKRECFPVSIYYRLLLETIIPSGINKILYLDGDIVVRQNLKELWQTDLANFSVGAIINQSISYSYWERLEYPKEKGYFNSGVLLINLKYWREHKLALQFIDYIKNNPEKLLYPDQDVLNYVLQDSKIFLPVRYNMQEMFYRINRDYIPCENTEEINAAIFDPYIIHYTAGKPWFIESNHPLKKQYYKILSKTQWKWNRSMEISRVLKFSYFKYVVKRILGIEKDNVKYKKIKL